MPIYYVRACLKCHQKEGTREGDLAGAITVTTTLTGIGVNRFTSLVNRYS